MHSFSQKTDALTASQYRFTKVPSYILGLVPVVFAAQWLPSHPAGNGIKEVFIALWVYLWTFIIFLKIKPRSPAYIWKLLCFTFWMKVALALANYALPLFPPTRDAFQNNEVALELACAWRAGNLTTTLTHPVELGYVLLMALVYFVFGYNLYLACLPNIIAAVATVYLVYKIAMLLVGRKEALIAATVYALMPYLNFMSFFFNREIIVIFIMAVFCYLAILWIKEKKMRHPWILLLVCLSSAVLRPENLVVIGPYLVFIYALAPSGKGRNFTLPLRMISILILSGIVVCTVISFFCQRPETLRFLGLTGLSPEQIYARPARHTSFGWVYLPETPPESWSEVFLSYGPLQAVNFLVRPVPWEVFRSNQRFLVANNMILYVLYGFALMGLLRLTLARDLRHFLAVSLFLFCSIYSSGLVQGNAFAATRHREQFIIFIYALAAGGLMVLYRTIKAAASKQLSTYTSNFPGQKG